MTSEDSVEVGAGVWIVVVDEWDVEAIVSVGLNAIGDGALGWGVDGVSLSLSSSQETGSSGSRAAPVKRSACGRNGGRNEMADP